VRSGRLRLIAANGMPSRVRGLCESSAGELAELVRRREVSSRQVVTAHLERIAALNAELGAVTRVLREEALAAADRCDHSEPRGPLQGLPFFGDRETPTEQQLQGRES
jgi:hypothetical protein